MLSVGFEPTIPAIEQPRTWTLDCMATGIRQRINNDIFLWIFLLVCNVLCMFNYMLLCGTVLIACTVLMLSLSHLGKKELSDITV